MTIRCRWPGGVLEIVLLDGQLDQVGLNDGDEIEVDSIKFSRDGIDVELQNKKGTLRYVPAPVGGTTWRSVFDAHGARALSEWRKIGDRAASTRRTRRRPMRDERWDEDREQFLARVLQRMAQHGENVSDAIDSTSKLDQGRFDRSFKGRDRESRLQAARQYYYRRRKDAADN